MRSYLLINIKLLTLIIISHAGLLGQVVQSVKINLLHSKDSFRVYSLPSLTATHQSQYWLRRFLEFRRHPDLDGELLLGVRSATDLREQPTEDSYFPEKYRINLTAPNKTVLVAEEVWKEAEILNPVPDSKIWYKRAEDNDQIGISAGSSRKFKYDGKTFLIRGKYWTATPRYRILRSQGRSYIATQSTDLKDPNKEKGKFYIQVFDLAKGKEIFWVEVRWKDSWISNLERYTAWIRDDVLVMAFDNWKRKNIVLCQVPKDF